MSVIQMIMLASAMTKITLAIKTITHFIADGKNYNVIDNDTNKDNDIEVDGQQLRWLKVNVNIICTSTNRKKSSLKNVYCSPYLHIFQL